MVQKQADFLRCLAILITWIFSHPGWTLTLGEGYVDNRRKEYLHMKNSLHRERLAQDLNLFIDGTYISWFHPAWKEIGAYWKGLDPRARWGGDFSSGDLNHFSFEHGGRA